MNTVTLVEIVNGVSKTTGKAFVRYDVTLDNGVKASGFEHVGVGDTVEVTQKGNYINYKKVGAYVGVVQPSLPTLPLPQPGVPISSSKPVSAPNVMTKDTYWERKEMFDREREANYAAEKPLIRRQHAQHMALLYATLKEMKKIEPKDLRLIINWFDRDTINHGGESSPIEEQAQEMFNATEVKE